MQDQSNLDTGKFKLSFSQIELQINIQQSSILGLCIKIGKTYSQYTQKQQLKNGNVKFSNILTIPLEQSFIFDKNPRKQKCQIMIYRYNKKQKSLIQINESPSQKSAKQKQNKNLIGMNSFSINPELFEQKNIKLRIIQKFDKEACISFNAKITHEIFNQYSQKISSIQKKSNYSVSEGLKYKKDNKNEISQQSWIQNELNIRLRNKKQSYDLSQSNIVEKNKQASIKEMGCYSQRQMIMNNQNQSIGNTYNKRNKNYNNKGHNTVGKIKKNDFNNSQKSSNYSSSHQNHHNKNIINNQIHKDQEYNMTNKKLLEICTNLQDQNGLLMNKIMQLQNHIFSNNWNNQGMRNFNNQSDKYMNNQSSTSHQLSSRLINSQTQYNKTVKILNKNQFNPQQLASMIKKSLKYIKSPSTQGNVSQSNLLLDSQIKNKQKNTQKQQPAGLLTSGLVYSFKQPSNMISIKELDHQLQCSKSFTKQKLSQYNQNIQKINLNQQSNYITSLNYTPQATNRKWKNNHLDIHQVINYFIISNKQQNPHLKIQKSIGSVQKNGKKGYKRFNDRKYKIIGKVSSAQSLGINNQKNNNQQNQLKKDYGMQTQQQYEFDADQLQKLNFKQINSQQSLNNNIENVDKSNNDKSNQVNKQITDSQILNKGFFENLYEIQVTRPINELQNNNNLKQNILQNSININQILKDNQKDNKQQRYQQSQSNKQKIKQKEQKYKYKSGQDNKDYLEKSKQQRKTFQFFNQLIQLRYRKEENYWRKQNKNIMSIHQSIKNQKLQYKAKYQQLYFSYDKEKQSFQTKIQALQKNIYQLKDLIQSKQNIISQLNTRLAQSQKQKELSKRQAIQNRKIIGYFIKNSRNLDQNFKQKQHLLHLINNQHKHFKQSGSQPELHTLKCDHSKIIFHSTNHPKPIQASHNVPSSQQKINSLAQKNNSIRLTNSSIFPTEGVRLSVTKLADQHKCQKNQLVTYSPSQLIKDKQKQVTSQALLNIRQRSGLQTKRSVQSYGGLSKFVKLKTQNSEQNQKYSPSYQTQRSNINLRSKY